MSPKTISNLHRCLHKALNQAVLEHYLDFNPCDAVNLPRNEKPQIEIFTREKQQRLIYTNYNFRFGGFIEPRTFKDFYNEILAASGLGHYTFHALRHTFATRAMEQGMDAKTLSTLLGHYSVAFTLDTYTHVLDSQKHEEMKLMEDLFSMTTVPQNQSYPVIVTPSPNGFILNPVDFEELKIEADNIQYGISCIQSSIVQMLESMYPPAPTPVSELTVNQNEFILMVNT